ncbi:MAG TPA: ATP-binding protein [Planctomycetota bacterium]|nr:ATP-binding protein [Planctomycetota bacterium]
MPGPFTEEERALRRSRLRLLVLAIPLAIGGTVAALIVLVETGAALSPAACMAILTLALVALNVYALVVVLRAHRTVDSMRETALNLLKDMKASFTPVATDAQLVARVGEKLAARTANLETERDALKAILAAMNEGILVVDSRRNVIFSNPAARKILGIPNESAPAQSQLTQHSELAANIEMSLVANQTCSFEFELADAADRQKRYIQAHCSPYKNEKQALFGAVAVLHDITELRRLERMRTEFVANVSHELRTPLTSLIGYLETMGEAGFDDQAQAREFLAVAHRQAEQLGHLVEDLLRLSRLENPQSDIAEAAVLLNEVVDSAVDQCASLAAKRAIDLRCETPDAEVWIDGDRGLLVQAVGNLIENAINYNHENGSITVSLSRALKQTPASSNGFHAEGPDDDFDWQIAVSDTGIGIPGHALNRIFERFYRVDKARSRSQGGTGLGLAIVKHIALAHGASVHVESEVGKGSTFFIRLKARRARSERLVAQV